MKLTICGKGGSGKSTVTTLLARAMAKNGCRVLVIDCDESNYGLHQMLGLPLPKSFTDYFGGKQRVLGMLSAGPDNMPMLFEHPWTLDDIPGDYVSGDGGVMLMTPGKIETANEACACPFNAVMAQFVPMLKLKDNDVVIMDMEAGIEHFGRGTDNATDCVIMVVDPSYESLKLSGKITEICEGIGKPVFYFLNKTTPANRDAVIKGIGRSDGICGELAARDDILAGGLAGEPLLGSDEAAEQAISFIKERLK